MPKKRRRQPAKKARTAPRKVVKRGPRAHDAAPEQIPVPAPAPAAAPASEQPKPVQPPEATPPSPEEEGGPIRAGLRSIHEKYESLLRQAQIGEEQRKEIEQELAGLSRRPLKEVAEALGISPEAAKHLIDMVDSMNT